MCNKINKLHDIFSNIKKSFWHLASLQFSESLTSSSVQNCTNISDLPYFFARLLAGAFLAGAFLAAVFLAGAAFLGLLALIIASPSSSPSFSLTPSSSSAPEDGVVIY